MAVPERKKRAERHTVYTPELGAMICELTAQSGIGLRHVCRQAGVAESTVRAWLRDASHPLSLPYALAKEMQLEHLAEEILELADDNANDIIAGERGPKTNTAAIQRARLQIETRKWLLAKLMPKRYGDRLDVNHAGQPGGLPIHTVTGHVVRFEDYGNPDD